MGHSEYDPAFKDRKPWNVDRKLGAKRALKPQQVWAIRFWLDAEQRVRDRAMFDIAIDSKLRGCDIVKIRIGDLISGGRVRSRAIVVQRKTGRPVQFELLEPARASILAWLERRGGTLDDFAFPSRVDRTAHMSTRVRAARGRMGHRNRIASGGLRDALAPPNQGLDDLQADRQLTGRADPSRTYEDREHRAIPRR
jgi:integrase